MEIEAGLFQWVGQQATLTAILAPSGAELRFHKQRIPQGGKTPATVQQRTGTARQHRGCAIDGAVAVSLQVDHYAKTTDAVADLARAFRRALDPEVTAYPVWMGTGDSPEAAIKVKAAALDNEFDADDSEPGLMRRTQLWTFWVFESPET